MDGEPTVSKDYLTVKDIFLVNHCEENASDD